MGGIEEVPGLRKRVILAQSLLTLPVAQGLGAQRQPRRCQRRLQQEQAGPRHQQREQGGEECGGGDLGIRAPEATRGSRGRHGRQTFPRAASALTARLGNFRLPAAVSPGNSEKLALVKPRPMEKGPILWGHPPLPAQRRPGVVVSAPPLRLTRLPPQEYSWPGFSFLLLSLFLLINFF